MPAIPDPQTPADYFANGAATYLDKRIAELEALLREIDGKIIFETAPEMEKRRG